MRYHAYALKNPRSAHTPYVLDIQSDLLAGLRSRVVAPLRRASAVDGREIMQGLMPTLMIGGEAFILLPQEMASVPLTQLQSVVADLSSESTSILNALDRLLS